MRPLRHIASRVYLYVARERSIRRSQVATAWNIAPKRGTDVRWFTISSHVWKHTSRTCPTCFHTNSDDGSSPRCLLATPRSFYLRVPWPVSRYHMQCWVPEMIGQRKIIKNHEATKLGQLPLDLRTCKMPKSPGWRRKAQLLQRCDAALKTWGLAGRL